MRKLLAIFFVLFACTALVRAEQNAKNYFVQIASAADMSAATIVSVPCMVHKIVLANPGSLTQLITLYDGSTVIGLIESDNVENVILNFDEPLICRTSFKVITSTVTASSYISAQATLGLIGTAKDGGQMYRTYTSILTSGAPNIDFAGPVEIGLVSVSCVTTTQVIKIQGLTEGEILRMTVKLDEYDIVEAYDNPIPCESQVSVNSSDALDDAHIIIHYRPKF